LSVFSGSPVSLKGSRKQVKERTMTGMLIFDLILSIAVVGGLAAVCRVAYLRAEHRHAEPTRVETPEAVALERAA
jgi:hypothetical protein